MAPILPFTADEAWDAMPAFEGKEESVHLALFPEADETGSEPRPGFVEEMDGLIARPGEGPQGAREGPGGRSSSAIRWKPGSR